MARGLGYTSSQVENAKKLIIEDFIKGVPYMQIREKLQKVGYGDVKYGHTKTADQFVYNARKELKQSFQTEIKELFETQYYRLTNVYAKCLEEGDKLTAYQCLREINRLAGFTVTSPNPTVQLLVNGEKGNSTNEITISFNTDNETVQIEQDNKPKAIETDCEVIK